MTLQERRDRADQEALDFHRYPQPGKISIAATKPMATQRDLSLAYSPGVAAPVRYARCSRVSVRSMAQRARSAGACTIRGPRLSGLSLAKPAC